MLGRVAAMPGAAIVTEAFYAVSRVGDRLVGKIIPEIVAGACIPDNGLICRCLSCFGCSDGSGGGHANQGNYGVWTLNCNGDCIDLHQCLCSCQVGSY